MVSKYGMKVMARIMVDGHEERAVFRNVTEVHYRYSQGTRVAFESDIHGTGTTYETVPSQSHFCIEEFEVRPETELAKHFVDPPQGKKEVWVCHVWAIDQKFEFDDPCEAYWCESHYAHRLGMSAWVKHEWRDV